MQGIYTYTPTQTVSLHNTVLQLFCCYYYYYYYYHHHHHHHPLYAGYLYLYPYTNCVPTQYSVAAILLLLFTVLIPSVSVFNLLHLYISTSRSVCAVPNVAVCCSSFTACFPLFLLLLLLILFGLTQPLQPDLLLAARCRFLEDTESPWFNSRYRQVFFIPIIKVSNPSRWLTEPYITQGSLHLSCRARGFESLAPCHHVTTLRMCRVTSPNPTTR